MAGTVEYECFAVAVDDRGVAEVRFTRGERLNTMTPAFWDELPRVVSDLEARGDVRCAILSGEGRLFSAGMDVSVFTSGVLAGADTPAERLRFADTLRALQRAVTAWEDARFPVIAVVHGACVGGAVDLVAAVDVRVATADAFFSIAEIQLALMADLGTLQRLPHLLGEGIVRELAYTGDRLGAERAERLGLVNSVHPDKDAALAHARELAGRIATRAPLAVAATKRAITAGRGRTTSEALETAVEIQAAVWNPPEIMEAAAARAEDREGEFADLGPRAGGPFEH